MTISNEVRKFPSGRAIEKCIPSGRRVYVGARFALDSILALDPVSPLDQRRTAFINAFNHVYDTSLIGPSTPPLSSEIQALLESVAAATEVGENEIYKGRQILTIVIDHGSTPTEANISQASAWGDNVGGV